MGEPHAKFHVYRGNVLPLRGEKPIFGPLSKNNTGMAALRAGLPVIIFMQAVVKENQRWDNPGIVSIASSFFTKTTIEVGHSKLVQFQSEVVSGIFTAMRMHRADYAMERYLSVCPSVRHMPVLCVNGYKYPHSFFTIE